MASKDRPSVARSPDSHCQINSKGCGVLSAADIALYRQGFRAVSRNKSGDLKMTIASISNPLLVGVLEGRMILQHPKSANQFMIRDWLIRYSDLPMAKQVYDLGLKLTKSSGLKLKTPKSYSVIQGHGDDLPAWIDQRPDTTNQSDEIIESLSHLVSIGKYQAAVDSFYRQTEGLDDQLQIDWIATSLATRLYTSSREEIPAEFQPEANGLAYELVAQASRSSESIPQAPWLAGLLQWQLSQYETAIGYFVLAANSAGSSPWSEARASYWAGRANLELDRQAEATDWFTRAAEQSYSFYGQLASTYLQIMPVRNWNLPEIKAQELARLETYPTLRRARALLQVGEKDLADLELRASYLSLPAKLRPLVLTLAESNGMPGLALRLATALERQTGRHYDAGYYPDLKLQPKSGFIIDPALLHGFARIESKFNSNARSQAGAHGLMQIMPSTANWLNRKASKSNSGALNDPRVSLDLAQRLIAKLITTSPVNRNLIFLALAYNGGNGMLTRSQNRLEGINDPLLYIESLVEDETRLYVKRVLNSYWVYQTKLGQEPTSLQAMARGEWPVYDYSGANDTKV
ncbi:MAG: transglycosylase SLT domain-containing protein, partial [Candidatus Pacebacteria bacterium]|nr:transglycosylase SLT domain-containing protein [Candidatus Paceibacterota bacterium]